MKITSFAAHGVFGYLDFNLRFEQQLTFLVGANGSGKSTALHLMEALLTPSLKDLALIDFDFAEITFSDNGGQIKTVRAHKNEKFLTLSADWLDEVLAIPEIGQEKARLIAEDQRSAEEYFRNLTIRVSSDSTFKAISELPAPVFLGIERRHRANALESHDHAYPDSYFESGLRRGQHVRRILKGTLAAGLAETQLLLQEAYRSARRKLDGHQQSLRNDVLLSAFHYSDVDRDEDGPTFAELQAHRNFDVDAIRADIEKTLAEIGLGSEDVRKRIGPFFDKLSQLTRKESREKDSDFLVEFLMNKGQLDRLQTLLALVQEHKRRTDAVTRKLSSFVEAVNWFYEDAGKRIVLDTVGRLVISRADGKHIPLDALSSGERQLLIIFSHLYFNAFGPRSGIFVVDEPELSLHIRWQENLITKMREAAPEMQLIIATHSPDVVGEFEEFCVEVQPNV